MEEKNEENVFQESVISEIGYQAASKQYNTEVGDKFKGIIEKIEEHNRNEKNNINKDNVDNELEK